MTIVPKISKKWQYHFGIFKSKRSDNSYLIIFQDNGKNFTFCLNNRGIRQIEPKSARTLSIYYQKINRLEIPTILNKEPGNFKKIYLKSKKSNQEWARMCFIYPYSTKKNGHGILIKCRGSMKIKFFSATGRSSFRKIGTKRLMGEVKNVILQDSK